MDYLKDFGWYPKRDEKVFKEGSDPSSFAFCGSTCFQVKGGGFGEETKEIVTGSRQEWWRPELRLTARINP